MGLKQWSDVIQRRYSSLSNGISKYLGIIQFQKAKQNPILIERKAKSFLLYIEQKIISLGILGSYRYYKNKAVNNLFEMNQKKILPLKDSVVPLNYEEPIYCFFVRTRMRDNDKRNTE